MLKRIKIPVLSILVLCFASAWAQQTEPVKQPDIFVGDIQFPSLRWGTQKAEIPLTNNTDELKFVVMKSHIAFQGTYMNPERSAQSSAYLEPHGTATVTAEVEIPPNYGHADLKIVMYDVVDTVDAVLPSQQFFDQSFQLNFNIPDEMAPYMSERLTLPPRVEVHPYFDNEFVRVLFVLLEEGKSAKQISDIAQCDSSFVGDEITLLAQERYLKPIHNDSAYIPAFPIILVKEAEQVKPLADKLSEDLAKKLAVNLKGYRPTLDSLVAAGVAPKDSNDFISGATCLYREFPIVATMLLWYDLGQKFITDTMPLLIYENTDVCNASNIDYYYEVQGGPVFNGNQFYALLSEPKAYRFLFSDHPLDLNCPSNYLLLRHLGRAANWDYQTSDYPEYFIVDSSAIRPMLNNLDDGITPMLKSAHKSLGEVAAKFGHKELTRGYRYWFWNLVATKTLGILESDNVVKRRDKANFRFDSLNK